MGTAPTPNVALMEGGRARLVLAAMTLANAMILVDQTAVPLALPDIMQSLDVGAQSAQWVLTGSLLPLSALLVFGGRIGDLLGRRRIFLLGTVLFAGGSALGGLAPTFPLLLCARVLQGTGGAMMLPATVAIVSATFPDELRGRALGTMGGIAAVAGALGPTIGGSLTSWSSWRAVLLVNLPLAVVTVAMTVSSAPADVASARRPRVDIGGAILLALALAALVLGLSQGQTWGYGSPVVVGSFAVTALAGAGFVLWERRSSEPLVDLALLRHRNYLGANISQALAGMAEMGLGVIFPLVLVLNLGMSPALAGLALIPTTVPMIIVAPLAGRWYDRAGGRPPLVVGFALLALSGLAMAVGVDSNSFLPLLPGLFVYGIGLALVLTVNDPTTLDQIPPADHGQASGVSATAEQFGGALGIAVLYSIFHATYLRVLSDREPNLVGSTLGDRLRDQIEAAQQTGLHPDQFKGRLEPLLFETEHASDAGYTAVFLAVAAIAVVAGLLMLWLVRRVGAPQRSP